MGHLGSRNMYIYIYLYVCIYIYTRDYTRSPVVTMGWGGVGWGGADDVPGT